MEFRKNLEVILIEDDPYDAELLMRVFKKHNFANNVVLLKDGVEALDYFFQDSKVVEEESSKSKVVFLDLKMPRVDGIEVLRRLRADSRTKDIPIVILTGSKEEKDLKNAYALGVACYITKPLKSEQFVSLMSEFGAKLDVIKGKVHILILEDNPGDAELIKRELQRSIYNATIEVARDKDTFHNTLDRFNPDIILTDYNIPGFNGIAAMYQARQHFPDIPTILVSGAIGEEAAVEALKSGVNDYVLKSRLSRIGPVTNRALQEAKQIAERKRAEEALKESEERWAATLSSIGDAVMATDINGKITFMNSIAEELTGWSLAEASHKPMPEVFPLINEEIRKEVENPVDKVLKEGVVVSLANHTILIRKDGEEIPIDYSGSPIKNQSGIVTGVVLVFHDITERRKAESALRASEIKFRTVANLTYDWEYWIGCDGAVLFTSPSCERFTGYTPDDFIRNPKLLNQIVHPDDRAVFDTHDELVSSEKGHEIDFRIISRDGITHWVYHACQPVFDNEGNWIGRRVSNREITERKKAEEALRESEERLNRSQEIAHLGSWELDLKENMLAWSDEVYRIFGFKPQEFGPTYEAFLAAVHPDNRAAVDAAYSCSLKEDKDGYEIEHRVVRKDNGETRFVHEKCTHIRDKSGQIIKSVGMVHDITERKKAEEEVRCARDVAQSRAEELEQMQIRLEEKAAEVEEYASQMEQIANERLEKLKDTERLAAIGATAGMVGHDIRNPLQAITSDAYLAKAELAAIPDSEQKKMALDSIEEIEKNVGYINKIVQDLQDYARPLNPKIEESDIQQIIENLISKNGLPNNIKVNIKVDENARKIKIDSYFLHRILYNLVTNSVQAMSQGGKLTIQLKREADDIILAVSDTGIGIPKDIQDKMFTIMFTTKSKGQGFGLPVVKRMTESLGGAVTFESQEGKGTTFTVRLHPPREIDGKWTYK